MSNPFGAPSLGRVVACKLCGAPIRFLRHIHSGEPAPFDQDAVSAGEWAVVAGIGYVAAKDERARQARFFVVSHFGTCPEYLRQRAEERAARLAAQSPKGQPAAGAPGATPAQLDLFGGRVPSGRGAVARTGDVGRRGLAALAEDLGSY